MLALAQAYWKLIHSAKKWLIVTLCLFALGVAGGVVIGITKPSLIEQALEHDRETGFPYFIHILKNNLWFMLISWCASLVLGIGPLLLTPAGGLMLGGLLVYGSVSYWFLAMFPHGIVELPAMLLSNAFFLRLGLRWALQKNATDRKSIFATDFQNSFKIALLCTFLFSVAAIIESFGTPKITAAYEKEHLAGIGVKVAIQEQQLTITHVFPGGPASKAGFSSGLLIQKIDGTETAGKYRRKCSDMIHGRVGTKVKLEVIDTVHSKTNTVELVRDLKP
jgi:uncharacterized membrane protein SpoIIM required for sporulation